MLFILSWNFAREVSFFIGLFLKEITPIVLFLSFFLFVFFFGLKFDQKEASIRCYENGKHD